MDGQRSLLLVVQGMDTSGKGGIMRHVVGSMDPQGVRYTAFKAPTAEERSHPFLWRIRNAMPYPGQIGVFDRSHYEDVLIVRVHDLVPKTTWSRRYAQINAFEEKAVAAGTTVVKVMLHVSSDEQKARLTERLERPDKQWKYNPGDVDERVEWPHYQEAYQAVLDPRLRRTRPPGTSCPRTASGTRAWRSRAWCSSTSRRWTRSGPRSTTTSPRSRSDCGPPEDPGPMSPGLAAVGTDVGRQQELPTNERRRTCWRSSKAFSGFFHQRHRGGTRLLCRRPRPRGDPADGSAHPPPRWRPRGDRVPQARPRAGWLHGPQLPRCPTSKQQSRGSLQRGEVARGTKEPPMETDAKGIFRKGGPLIAWFKDPGGEASCRSCRVTHPRAGRPVQPGRGRRLAEPPQQHPYGDRTDVVEDEPAGHHGRRAGLADRPEPRLVLWPSRRSSEHGAAAGRQIAMGAPM